MFEPATDGTDHINVYSRGQTPLGRFLSNFASSPFELPDHGSFRSVEGYWFWLIGQRVTSRMRQYATTDDYAAVYLEPLREMSGIEAKTAGKIVEGHVPDFTSDDPVFQQNIRKAITAKLLAFPDWLAKLKENTLPLAHYYVYDTKVVDAGYKWILEHIESCKELPLPEGAATPDDYPF